MPLDKSCDLKSFQSNISKLYKEGKRAKGTQHVAIALSTLKRACGVPDDNQKMTPKEIVAAGAKGEGTFVRLAALMERETTDQGGDTEVAWFKWVARLRDVAGMAAKEAGRWKRGPATNQLVDLLQDFLQKRVALPTFEDTGDMNPGAGSWLEWTSRLEMAASNRAVPELGKLIREFKDGRVSIPSSVRESSGERASAESMATAPSGSLLVSKDGMIAWRKTGPSKSSWVRQMPSASSADGWKATEDANGGLRTFQNIVRAMKADVFYLVQGREGQ